MKRAAPYRAIPEKARWCMTERQSRRLRGALKNGIFIRYSNERLCLQFTIGHAAYAGQVSLMLFDFIKGEKLLDLNKILVLPFGSLHMPTDAEKDNTLSYEKGGVLMRFQTKNQKRVLTCRWGNVEVKIR